MAVAGRLLELHFAAMGRFSGWDIRILDLSLLLGVAASGSLPITATAGRS
jgi:hypothetical protein